jgi:hypothetical protein
MRTARALLASLLIMTLGGQAWAGTGSPSPGPDGPPARAATFATPEDAVHAYLAAFAAGDTTRMLAATAVDDMAEGFRLDRYVERIRSIALINALAPGDQPFYADLNRSLLAGQILRQALMLAYSLATPMDDDDLTIPRLLDDATELIAAIDPSGLTGLTVEDVRFPNARFESDERYLRNSAAQAAMYSADEQTERLALVELDGQLYLVGFMLLRYGDAWRVSNQASPLAGTSFVGAAVPTTAEEYERITSGA